MDRIVTAGLATAYSIAIGAGMMIGLATIGAGAAALTVALS